jgi:hypothetical protein
LSLLFFDVRTDIVMKSIAEASILAFFLGLAALHGCLTSAEARPQANGAGLQQDDLADGDMSAPTDGDAASLAKDLRWLKERTAEVQIRRVERLCTARVDGCNAKLQFRRKINMPLRSPPPAAFVQDLSAVSSDSRRIPLCIVLTMESHSKQCA